MASLIDSLFNHSESDAIKKLWNDKNTNELIKKEIGKQLLNTDKILIEMPLVQILLITSLSPFAESIEECDQVACIIYWGIKEKDILPMITEQFGKPFAYRCLISLGFFKRNLAERCKRYAAPSPSFYREAGIRTFNAIGMTTISHHFKSWESFLEEMFVLESNY
jgi:hypothetical protein